MSGSSASSVFAGGSSYDLTSTSHSQASQSQAFDGFDFGFSDPSHNGDNVSEGIQPAIQDPTSTRSYFASLSRLDSKRWSGTESAAEILQAGDFSSSSGDGTVGGPDTRADMTVRSSAGGEDSSAMPTFASNQTVQVSEPEVDSSLPMSASVDFSQGWHNNYLGHDGDGDDSQDGTSIEMLSKDTQSTLADIPPPESAAPTGLGVTLTDGSSFDGSGYRRNQYPSIISYATSALTKTIDERLSARGDLGYGTDRSEPNASRYSFDGQEESISVAVNSPSQPLRSSPYNLRYAPTGQLNYNSDPLSTFDTSQSAPVGTGATGRTFNDIFEDMANESQQDVTERRSVTSQNSQASWSRARDKLHRISTSMSASHVISSTRDMLSSATSRASSWFHDHRHSAKGKKPANTGSERRSWMPSLKLNKYIKNRNGTSSRSGDEIDSEEEYDYGSGRLGERYLHASDMPPNDDTAFGKETAPLIF